MSSYYRKQLEDWLKTIDVKADRVLDVGGADNPVKERTKSWNAGDYRVLDRDQSHKGLKPNIIFDIQKDQVSFIDIDWDEEVEKYGFYLAESANIVFCLEVFEYIYDPLRALEHINDLMIKEGTLYISFPFVYPVHEPAESDYLRYTKFGAEKLLELAGFEILENKSRVVTSGDIGRFYRDEKMRYKGAMRTNTFHDIGYLIKARKV